MFLLVAIIATSCSTPQYTVIDGFIDYSAYGDSNFFITESNSVSFPYEPMGSVTAIVLSGNMPNTSHWVEAKPQAAMRAAVEKARLAGANGLINLKISSYETTTDGKLRIGLIVTGMAIKR